MPQRLTPLFQISLRVLLVAVVIQASTASGQTPPSPDSQLIGEEIFHVATPKTKVKMIHLDSRVVELGSRIKIVDGFNPDILSVTALSPTQVRMRAESPGVTSLKLIDEFDNVSVVEVFVEPDTRELQAYLERLFPGTSVEAIGLKDAVVLRGWVTEPTQIPQMMAVAEQFYPVVQNQLNVGGVTQVQLHVKVIEVQRTKLRDLGFNMLMVGQQYFVANTIGSVGILSEVMAPFGGPPTVGAQGTPEIQFAITGNSDVFQGFLKMLQSEALAKILAEPVLVTTSGRPASMLSGGEFPILVPQSLGSVSIDWRDFGVRLEAVPVVLGNGRLRLDVAPEVSERDFSNAVSIDGFVVPGITVRRVNTQVEMRFGETLMIGGLISTRRTGTMRKIPFLGELPWIGAAFSRKDYSVGETELVILVTPELVAPMQPHQVPALGPGQHTDIPTDKELYFDGMLEVPRYGPECETGACPPQQLYTPAGTNNMHMPYEEVPEDGSFIPQTPFSTEPVEVPVEVDTSVLRSETPAVPDTTSANNAPGLIAPTTN